MIIGIGSDTIDIRRVEQVLAPDQCGGLSERDVQHIAFAVETGAARGTRGGMDGMAGRAAALERAGR